MIKCIKQNCPKFKNMPYFTMCSVMDSAIDEIYKCIAIEYESIYKSKVNEQIVKLENQLKALDDELIEWEDIKEFIKDSQEDYDEQRTLNSSIKMS